MKSSVEYCLEKIENVRIRNNKCWMQLVRLAIEQAPEEAAAILRDIEINDRKVNELWHRLSEQLNSQ